MFFIDDLITTCVNSVDGRLSFIPKRDRPVDGHLVART